LLNVAQDFKLVNHLLRVFWPVVPTFSHPYSFADTSHVSLRFLYTITTLHVGKPEAWKVQHVARVKCLVW